MSEATDAIGADRALKARHRAMWAMGDYASVASHVIPRAGAELVGECGVRRGDRVLDVAAGAGNAAIPAALTGADVVASDLTPELLEVGRNMAGVRGARLEWREADAEHLPFADGEFDVVMSCFGVMFAPRSVHVLLLAPEGRRLGSGRRRGRGRLRGGEPPGDEARWGRVRLGHRAAGAA
ncbi:class I SAM-dependent methyltransferase, partial [Streptomyces xanthophaeus]|uniref:class I SAM-dependent methyltransferase n=1 Tax=Streptomyces xanthophaeus TaxID=67385 RepID=UPI003669C689